MGAMISHLAHLQELAMARNLETAFRFGRAQSAKWSQLARNRGDPSAMKNDLRSLNHEGLAQRANDQQAASNEQKKGYEQKKAANPPYPARGKGARRNRPRSRRRDSKDPYWKASRSGRAGGFRRDQYEKDEESAKKPHDEEDEEKKKVDQFRPWRLSSFPG